MDGRIVKLVVKSASPKVFDCILDGSDEKNDYQGDRVQTGVAGAEDGEYLGIGISGGQFAWNAQRLTERMMMKRKYIFAMLWNWK